jgi:hypothetical protein
MQIQYGLHLVTEKFRWEILQSEIFETILKLLVSAMAFSEWINHKDLQSGERFLEEDTYFRA